MSYNRFIKILKRMLFMDATFIIINLVVFFALLVGVFFMQKKHIKFSYRVLIALGIGLVFGGIIQLLYGADSYVTTQTTGWMGLIGNGFIRLLRMIVIPLIFVSILSAFAKLEVREKFLKSAVKAISILLITVAISAVIGITTAIAFNLDASSINLGEAENARSLDIESTASEIEGLTLPEQITQLIPANPFLDFTGQRGASTIAVVIFTALLGYSLLKFKKHDEVRANKLSEGILILNDFVMELVKIILRLTPYGILAIMANTVATSDFRALVDLSLFVVASYVALIAMFIVHLIIIALTGLNPFTYVKKTAEVLLFAFTSRSSAGALPLNIQTQTTRLGVPSSVANFSASFGLSIGQNGCAGIYPSMLAIMVAPVAGVNVDLQFILTLIVVIVVTSLGIAGVGGGATFAAIIVLSTMNLPVALAAVLISVEPLIDMGRTALNVSDSMVAGTVTAKTDGTLDKDTYDNMSYDELTTSNI